MKYGGCSEHLSNSTFPTRTPKSSMKRSSNSNKRRNTSLTTDGTTTPITSRTRRTRSTRRRILTFVRNSLYNPVSSNPRETSRPPHSETAKTVNSTVRRRASPSSKAQLSCNGRTITYNDDSVSLATTDKRVTAEYVTPVNKNGTPFADYWTDEWEKAEATLHKRDGTYSSTSP